MGNEISVDALVNGILNGERDFSGREFPKGMRLADHRLYAKLQTYLKTQNMAEKPLVLTNANLEGVVATGLYLPYVKAVEANLRGAILDEADFERACLIGANLEGAYLRKADLEKAGLRRADLGEADLGEADLRGAYLCEANLEGAHLWKADLIGADLRGAYLGKANLKRANLWGADLRGARGLGTAVGVEWAIFHNTHVGKSVRAIIIAAREQAAKEMFA